MSALRSKQIQCLERLQHLTSTFEEIDEFLVSERLVTKEDMKVIKTAPMKAKEMQILLDKLSRDGKFQLLEYSWSILPVENIIITIVTDNAKREFTYSGS